MSTELINYEAALERLGGDSEFLAELLHEMLEQIKSQIDELEQAVSSQDFTTVHHTAHGLKGASANLDITRMFELFRDLEQMGATQNLDGADELLDQIKSSTDELREFVAGL